MARATEERKNSFVMYLSWGKMLQMLDSSADVGDVILSLFSYLSGEDISEMKGGFTKQQALAFEMMTDQINKDRAKYQETCEKRSKAAKDYRNYVRALEQGNNGQVVRSDYVDPDDDQV